jgi:hypothetical protein
MDKIAIICSSTDNLTIELLNIYYRDKIDFTELKLKKNADRGRWITACK